MNKNLIIEDNIYEPNNEVDFIYYDEACKLYPDIDFELYVSIDKNNNYIISLHDYFNCLLENDLKYKNYVIDEILYDVNNYGYYANVEIEETLGLITTILDEEMLRGKLEDEEINELEQLRNRREEKVYNKRKRKHK